MRRRTSAPRPGKAVLAIASMTGGGAERHVSYLACGMAERGWDVTLALLEGGPNLDRLRGTAVKVERLAHVSNYDPQIVAGLASLIRRARPDVVQGWMPLMNAAGAAAARAAGAPFLGGEQACGDHYGSAVRDRLESFALGRWAAGVVANSEGGRRSVRDRLGARVPAWVIPNGVPVAEIDAAPPVPRADMGVADDAEVLLYAGRFDAQKNLAALSAALPAVLEARPKAVAVLCGDGPERPRWEAWARERGLEARIRFAGYVTGIWGWMKAADAFVFPSWFEGQPNAVMEAMACGCPMVVSDIPAHREFLDADTALLTPPASPGDLAAAAIATLADRAAARARAARANERVRRYTIDAMVEAHETLYHQVAEARHAALRAGVPRGWRLRLAHAGLAHRSEAATRWR